MLLINPPALKANIPAAKLINAGPANNKFAKLMPDNSFMPSANIGKLFATKVSPMPNGINVFGNLKRFSKILLRNHTPPF